MSSVPFIGRLDVTLACLLVVERHGSLAGRAPTPDDIWRDVLSLTDLLEIPADYFEDIESFEAGVEAAIERLVEARWIGRRKRGNVIRHPAVKMSAAALDWIRARLSDNPHHMRAFEALHLAVTERVLDDYSEGGGAESQELSAEAAG